MGRETLKKEDTLRHLRVKLELCRDRNTDQEVDKTLDYSIRLIKEAKYCNPGILEKLTDAAQELEEELLREDFYTARVEVRRLSELADRLNDEPERRSLMKILSGLFGKKKSAEDIKREEMDNQFQQTEESIVQLQRQISRLSAQWDNCYGELQKLAEQSIKLDRKNPRYAQILAEAKGKQNRLQILEAQVKQYSAALQNNSEYQTMLENGRISGDLSSLVPDVSKAEVLMEQIFMETEGASEKVRDIGDLVEHGNKRILDALGEGMHEPQDMAIFEQMQQEARNTMEQNKENQNTDIKGENLTEDAGHTTEDNHEIYENNKMGEVIL